VEHNDRLIVEQEADSNPPDLKKYLQYMPCDCYSGYVALAQRRSARGQHENLRGLSVRGLIVV